MMLVEIQTNIDTGTDELSPEVMCALTDTVAAAIYRKLIREGVNVPDVTAHLRTPPSGSVSRVSWHIDLLQ